MKIFLVGISCVGKSIIGKELANELGSKFFDFDKEVELYFNKSIPQIQSQFIDNYSYRDYISLVLKKIIKENATIDYVVVLPPSGLRDCFLRILKKVDCVVIALHDKPENILERLVFFDDNSNKIDKVLTEKEKKLYLREIKKDNTYFNRTYKRTNYHVELDGSSVKESVIKIKKMVNDIEDINENNSISSKWVK